MATATTSRILTDVVEVPAEDVAALTPRHGYTVEDYLSFERGSESKHEYFNGEILAMVGASEPHALIVTNITICLGSQLRGRPCKVYSSTLRLKVSPTGLFTYPDVMVICGGAQFDDEHRDVVVNPKVLVEVLSPSTEAYDRGAKVGHYKTVDSLTDYLLVAQDSHRVEQRARQSDGQWQTKAVDGIDAVVRLESIDCELPLREIYYEVELKA